MLDMLYTFSRVRKIVKATISFVMSVRMSAWITSFFTGLNYMTFCVRVFSKICRERSNFIKL